MAEADLGRRLPLKADPSADPVSVADGTEKLLDELRQKDEELRQKEEQLRQKDQTIENLRQGKQEAPQSEETIYLLRNPADRERDLWKIGKTKNSRSREAVYKTSMPDGPEVAHRCYTKNAAVAERAVHWLLDAYRYEKGREWF